MKVLFLVALHFSTDFITSDLILLLAEVLLLENEVIVFKSGSDVKFFVVGSSDEVTLLLVSSGFIFYHLTSNLLL